MVHSTRVESKDLSKWIRLAQEGDDSAFGPIVSETQNRLYRFCLQLTGDAQTSEELLQDTYLKVAQRIRELKNPDGFITWIYRIARNLLIDSTRSAEHKLQARQVADSSTREGAERESLLACIPSESAHRIDEVLAIRQALLGLETEERLVLLLVDHEGLSYAEAAKVMGKTENSIRQKVGRARKKFLKLFDTQ